MNVEQLLNRLALEDLKSVAHFNNLPDKGTKSKLISIILGANLPSERILEFTKVVSLKLLLANEGLPRTGRRSELEKRLLSILEKPEGRLVTAYSKGHGFEQQVASWARRALKELKPTVEMSAYASGLRQKRPYDVDVRVNVKGKGFLAKKGADVWIECKWKDKSSVKSKDIETLVTRAKDVYKAAHARGGELYYNGLILASNQRFDRDALNYANYEGVLCVRFYEKKVEEQNPETIWLGEPAWLMEIR